MNILNKVTLKTLQKNKVRTVVTIIGIILSAAMLTAVTTAVSSILQYMTNLEAYQCGTWHASFLHMKADDASRLKTDPGVQQFTVIQDIGFADLKESENEYKPYLFIGGMVPDKTELLPIRLTAGKLPSSRNEILLPEHLATNGRVKYSLGETLSLDVGVRIAGNGEILQNAKALRVVENEDPEAFDEIVPDERIEVRETRTFTVVGFYERPNFENYEAPGYTALTLYEETAGYSESVYFTVPKAKEIFAFSKHFTFEPNSEPELEYNSGYLRALGVIQSGGAKNMIYSFAAILIGIVIFGSIALIYNSFSISVNERIKQFGLLSSVGATKKQLLRSILFEASSLCLIGLPVGVLSGIGGIWVTFLCIRDKINLVLGSGSGVLLSCHVSWLSVLIAVLLGFLTVMFSAYRPARRALKMPVIEAIRQSNEIRIKPGKVKTSKLTYRLFGFEGMLASKNFKRNKKKYRATVFSLFVSIVLFISTSSFCDYLISAGKVFTNPMDADIGYYMVEENRPLQEDNTEIRARIEKVFQGLANIPGVKAASYYKNISFRFVLVPVSALEQDFVDFQKSQNQWESLTLPEGEFALLHVSTQFIDDGSFRDYCAEIGVDPEPYLNGMENGLRGIAVNRYVSYNHETEKRFSSNIFRGENDGCRVAAPRLEKGEELVRLETDVVEKAPYYYYEKTDSSEKEGDTIEKQKFVLSDDSFSLHIGAVSEKTPFSVMQNPADITLLFPYSAEEQAAQLLHRRSDFSYIRFAFQVNNHTAVYESMAKYLQDVGETTSRLSDYVEQAQRDRAYITIISVFSYGFIVLISLISVANVFNTISTNIQLRRREFAMLKSIGTTQRGFRKMMNFECILYGVKGVLYGLPVALAVTYLIYRSVSNSLESSFFVPWYSVAIAVGSVFVVVFATMLYAMRQIRKDNPIDALRNENL